MDTPPPHAVVTVAGPLGIDVELEVDVLELPVPPVEDAPPLPTTSSSRRRWREQTAGGNGTEGEPGERH